MGTISVSKVRHLEGPEVETTLLHIASWVSSLYSLWGRLKLTGSLLQIIPRVLVRERFSYSPS